MPTVPSISSPGASSLSLLEKPSPENILMAAATMHSQGAFSQGSTRGSSSAKRGALKVVK